MILLILTNWSVAIVDSSYNAGSELAQFPFKVVRNLDLDFRQIRLYTTEPKRMARSNDTLMSVRAPVGRPNCRSYGIAALVVDLTAIHSKSKPSILCSYTRCFRIKKQLECFQSARERFLVSINRNVR